MPALSEGYHAVRRRIAELAGPLDGAALTTAVPACPAWSVHDLLAHVSGMPDALASGDYPGADVQAWLDGIVAARRDATVADLFERWEAAAPSTSSLVDGGGGRMLVDVVVHEHDLRGALDRPGARGAPEVRAALQVLLDELAAPIGAAGLGALVVDSGDVRWASQFTRPGCTLRVDPWEALRALQSRRTADELRALPVSGDIGPYIAVLDAHSPLPETSLGEA